FSVSAFGDHLQYPIKNIANGKKSDDENQGARIKLLWKPTDRLDITLTGRFNHNQSHGENFVYTYVTPGSELLAAGTGLTQALLLPGITPSQSNQHYASVASGIGQTVYDQDVSLNINYQLGDFVLSSTTAYQFERLRIRQDLFAVDNFFFQTLTGGFAPPFYNFQQQDESIKQPSEELKLLSPADKPFSYILGFFASDTRVQETYERALIPALVDDAVTPDTKTYDVYGRATWKFAPSFSLIAGLRYNYDIISYINNQVAYSPITDAYNSRGRDTSSNVVGDITLQKVFSKDAMVYATYARGYSPEAYNTALPLVSNDTITPVKQENINNFEIGSKGTYFDRKLTLNISLFDTIYQNLQVQTYANEPGFVAPPVILVNANAHTRGVEFDSYYQPFDKLDFNFNAAYVDAKFTKYTDAECYSGQTTGCNYIASGIGVQDVTGKTLPNSPKFKFSLGVDKRIPLDATPFDLVLSGNYAYRTSAEFLPDQNPLAVQRAFGILNLNATLKSRTGKYAIEVFANNVLNTHYLTDIEDYWSSVWSNTNNVIGQPARDTDRYYGVRFNANF
ncbi:MAG: TonB-dependent receptor, partial [Caulobacteraceae bacterium]